jgi:hypothetical protein
MPILQKTLEEPLLTRQQVAVVRDIARAAQLAGALKELQMTIQIVNPLINESEPTKVQPITRLTNVPNVIAYLKDEVERVLMQIKTPKQHPDNSEPVPTNASGKGAK